MISCDYNFVFVVQLADFIVKALYFLDGARSAEVTTMNQDVAVWNGHLV